MKKTRITRICFLIIALLILAFLAGRGIRRWFIERHAFEVEDESPGQEETAVLPDGTGDEEPKYKSDTSSKDCKLCGSGEGTLLPIYNGQDNLGIISLNTFHVARIKINQYNDYGKLIKKAENSHGTDILNTGDGGFMSVISPNSNRGYASANVSMNNDRILDMEKVSANLCTDCLNEVMESAWSDPYGMGLINFKTGEICLFTEGSREFMLGDYYVLYEAGTEAGEEDVSEIDLHVFYCPERYD